MKGEVPNRELIVKNDNKPAVFLIYSRRWRERLTPNEACTESRGRSPFFSKGEVGYFLKRKFLYDKLRL
ncbi:MAG: hypothetical protein CEN92_224 [Candidatus Berkelbacteria bacterium Licking1014_96]|uniref:Uncharacterized protein n=1 Tax=Candidatus Berkelbacteria bacterium Licking1014_96 TaxID=2017149 RepID=A0A554LFN0_9BACT|nr:MAG: hypothetical protein CEN92_224 [Candidatus Berkelbacteria bacterium Licking1014_96]